MDGRADVGLDLHHRCVEHVPLRSERLFGVTRATESRSIEKQGNSLALSAFLVLCARRMLDWNMRSSNRRCSRCKLAFLAETIA